MIHITNYNSICDIDNARYRVLNPHQLSLIEWISLSTAIDKRQKGRDLTKSYDKNPYTHSKKQSDNTKTPPNNSILQRLQADLGRSVGVSTAIQLVLLNRYTGSQPSY